MTVRQLLPEGLAEMAPGPQLSAALDVLDLAALTGSDLVDVLQARARQSAHEQAQLLAVMAEIGRCDPHAGPDEVARLAQVPDADGSLVPAAEEIRAALAWTRNAAYREYHFAQSLLRRQRAVFTALDTGVICRSKAWLFTELCAQLTDEQAQEVAERLVPQAGRLTTGELAARIKKMAIALDPEWAARRYTAAVRDRDVIGYLDEDGTATVTGRRLPAEQAAAACARIEDLAKATKRAGYRGRIGPLRADIYLGLLEGRWTRHSRDEIILDLLARANHLTPDQPTTDHSAAADQTPTNDEPGTGDDAGATSASRADGSPEPDAPRTDADAAADGDAGADAQPEAEGTTGADPEADTSAADTSAADVVGGEVSVGGEAGDGAQASAPEARVGVELRVGLCTLLGLDRHPAEIPGWGAVTAETARTLAAAQHRAEWRYAITDPDGRLILGGLTRRRPSAPEGTRPDGDPGAGPSATNLGQAPIRGGIVEVHIPATRLAELVAHPETSGPWAAVISDLAAQYQAFTADILHRADTAGRQNPAARFAGATLRRHIQIRDRYCVFTGCRCPARHADLDHTVEHSRGGATTQANIGPVCRHDHLVKHDCGWRLDQPEPGHFIWTSPLGRTYHTRPQPITTDLPDPLPGPDYPDYPPSGTLGEDEPILYRPPPPEPKPPPAPAPADDPDEPPPF